MEEVNQVSLANWRFGSRPITSQDGGDWYEKGGPCVQEGEYSHPDRMWAMHIGGVHPIFHHNIIRCLDRDVFPRQQKRHYLWVPEWTSFHCTGGYEGEKESEGEEGSKKERWLKGCHIPPIIDSRYRRVTLSFTTVVAESWKSLLFIPHIICSALYPFSNIIIYVDSVVPRIVYTEFQRLIESGWVNEIRLVESDPAVYQPMLDGVFNAPPNTTIETKVWGAKGLLSYVQGLEECDTEYCLHLDDGNKYGPKIY